MAQGAATSADCPGTYDVVINGFGYMLLQTLEPSLPFRTHRAVYTYSPTFVERQNVSNSYGDQAQDFFLTVRQRDWSLGEQQKFFRAGQDGRYWLGQNVNVSTPGQVKLAPAVTQPSFAQSITSGAKEGQRQTIVVGGSTNLYRVLLDGSTSDMGSHGLGVAPGRFGIASDGLYNYITNAPGSVGVRRWDQTTFTSFSGSAATAIEFVNNTLYGYVASTGALIRWDTAGVATTLFNWKGAEGSATGGTICRMVPFGGKLLILFAYGQEAAELWIYDGIGVSRLEVFPENFIASDMEVLYGIAYVSGSFLKTASLTTFNPRSAVMFFDGSQIGTLWQANDFSSATISNTVSGVPHPTMGVSNGHLIFTDETVGNIMSYDPALGGVSTIGTFTSNSGSDCRFISTGLIQLHTRNQTGSYFLPASTYPTSGYVISSLIDFDSSLVKQFRGIKVEWDAASDGNGGSVDVAYQVDSLTGAWTTLQTGAVSGTEYTLSSVSGHSVAVKVTINKGTSAAGPALRSVSIRGAPQLQTFRNREYILDLSGTGYKDPVRNAAGMSVPLSGHEMALNLNTAITSSTPIQVSDRFVNQQTCLSGSTTAAFFTAMCEPSGCEIYDTAEGWDNPQHPGGYVAKITVREV